MYNNVFSSVNVKVNFGITEYYSDNDVRKKCIIGFPNIDRLNPTTPYFKYDLNSSGQVINGIENSRVVYYR